MSTATTIIPRSYKTYQWSMLTTPRSFAQPQAFWPAAGHYEPSNQPMAVVAPRPVSELSSASYYLYAYYDGTNELTMEYPLMVLGGSFPYVFELLSGPPGMYLKATSWIPGNTLRQMFDIGYAYLYFKPQAAITTPAPWIVRCYGADGDFIDITGAITTSSSTAQYVFCDSLNGSDTNAGTISAPFKTLLGVYGNTSGGATAFPGATLFLRGRGSAYPYQLFSPGGSGAIVLDPANNPSTVSGYPGDPYPILDISTGAPGGSFALPTGTSDDVMLRKLQFIGSTVGTNYWYLALSGLCNRVVCDTLLAPNVWGGVSPNDNSSLVIAFDPGGNVSRQYIGIRNCFETNRLNGGVQAAIHTLYKCNYVLTEGNHAGGTQSAYGMGCKAANYYVEFRCNWSPDVSFQLAAQDSNNAPTGSVEFRYNFGCGEVLNAQNTNGGPNGLVGPVWSNRNSLLATGVGDVIGVDHSAYIDTIASVSDALQWQSGGAPITTGPGITIKNTEAQGDTGILDPTTLELLGAYATDWLGMRGAQIS